MSESSLLPDNVIILNAVSILSDCHIITPGSTPDYPVPLFFREAGEEGNLVTVDYELPAALHLPDVPGTCVNPLRCPCRIRRDVRTSGDDVIRKV